eukprot:jgi/Mesvir1/2280/Mv19321-RA.1
MAAVASLMSVGASSKNLVSAQANGTVRACASKSHTARSAVSRQLARVGDCGSLKLGQPRAFPCLRASSRRFNQVAVRAAAASDQFAAPATDDLSTMKAKLLDAIRSYGGPEALGSLYNSSSEEGKWNVLELVLGVERLNPTPSPAKSLNIAGDWEFVWAGGSSPGIVAAQALNSLPIKELAHLEGIETNVVGGVTESVAKLKLLDAVEVSVSIKTNLLVESDMRLREKYISSVISSPHQIDTSGNPLAANVLSTLDSLMGGGLKLPMNESFQRQFLLTFLDDTMMIARDSKGVDIMVRLPGEDTFAPDAMEYES